MEEMNPPARAQTNWTPFVFGCVAGIAPWIVVFTYFFGGGNYSQVNELQPVPRQSAIAPAAHKAHRCLATAKRTDASLPGADSGGAAAPPLRVPWFYSTTHILRRQNYDQIPGFVYGILFGYLLFFNTFPVNMVLQYRRHGKWAEYRYVDCSRPRAQSVFAAPRFSDLDIRVNQTLGMAS